MTAAIKLPESPGTMENTDLPFSFEKYLLSAGAEQIPHSLNESYTGKSEIKRYKLGDFYLETITFSALPSGSLVVCNGFEIFDSNVHFESDIPLNKEQAELLFIQLGLTPPLIS